MRQHKNRFPAGFLLGSALFALAAVPVRAAAPEEASLASVLEESHISPIPSGNGKYMLKSSGFYCLNADGTKENTPAVYQFERFVIDGTVFDGIYYHDETGKFKAAEPELVHIKNLALPVPEGTENTEPAVLDGFYMADNMGKLTAAPQVRYLDKVTVDGTLFDGFYYFDENGRLVSEGGLQYIENMECGGREFSGCYYFGGADGMLSSGGVTAEGLSVDKNGRVKDMERKGLPGLKKVLEKLTAGYDGEWSVYVKDLGAGEELVLNNKEMLSASLIKAFVMEKTYENMDRVRNTEAALLKSTPDNAAVQVKVNDLLENMITVSDNESYNELVKLQTDKHDFAYGARVINRYLKKEGYENTSVQHTLAPSPSVPEGIGGNNTTSVKDCGILLEKIYRKKSVSREASKEMLDFLLAQQNTAKIPEGIAGDIKSANKTGENDAVQHDIAIVYGEKTDYILCVMSENCKNKDDAVSNIRNISSLTYEFLNR